MYFENNNLFIRLKINSIKILLKTYTLYNNRIILILNIL